MSALNLHRSAAPPGVNTPLWPACVCQCQGSSTDIIRGCIIIQATDSPRGGPAEAEPPSLRLSAVAWHPALPLKVGRSAEAAETDGEDQGLSWCRGGGVRHCPVIALASSSRVRLPVLLTWGRLH